MAQNIFITGTGREMALGFHFVLRYLEHGDHVIATVRKPSEALERLKAQYPGALDVLTMDIASTASVEDAAREAARLVPCIDLLINNAVTTSPDCHKELEDANLDYIAGVVDVDAVGPLRVVKALLPLLEKSAGTALIANISSEAGSIGKCYRTSMIDYGMAKAALNMGTMILRNKFRENPKLNIICVHPGWVRTSPAQAAAPFDPYDSAEILRKLFEEKRCDFGGPVFVQYDGTEYPW